MNEERGFKGIWIDKDIWLDNRLTATEKIILAEIDSLDIEGQGCTASNKYLSEFCQCTESKVSKAIAKLTELGLIRQECFNGRHRKLIVLKYCLAQNASLPSTNLLGCLAQNASLPSTKDNFLYIDKIDYKIDDNKKEIKKEKKLTNFDIAIMKYTENEEVRTALYEFIKMRKAIKKPLTDHALDLIIAKLDRLSKNDAERIAILNNSIANNWSGVYELRAEEKKALKEQKKKSEEEKPFYMQTEWIRKNIDPDYVDEDEE